MRQHERLPYWSPEWRCGQAHGPRPMFLIDATSRTRVLLTEHARPVPPWVHRVRRDRIGRATIRRCAASDDRLGLALLLQFVRRVR